jgi:hypothetical protein
MSASAKLPHPPQEPPACTSSNGLAPLFLDKIQRVEARMTAKGWHITRRETWRSDERAAWLYGFGRTWDDGRGIVTYATNALKTWHHYWLAVDYGDSRYEPGNEPAHFWTDLEAVAAGEHLTCGGDWVMKDKPHVQWGPPMRLAPSDHAAKLLASGGVEAVWKAVGAAD